MSAAMDVKTLNEVSSTLIAAFKIARAGGLTDEQMFEAVIDALRLHTDPGVLAELREYALRDWVWQELQEQGLVTPWSIRSNTAIRSRT